MNSSEYTAVYLNKSDDEIQIDLPVSNDTKKHEKLNGLKIFLFALIKSIANLKKNVYADYHNNKISSGDVAGSVSIEKKGGLANKFVLLLLFLWYIFSALTLYTNKYIISTKRADATLIGKVK